MKTIHFFRRLFNLMEYRFLKHALTVLWISYLPICDFFSYVILITWIFSLRLWAKLFKDLGLCVYILTSNVCIFMGFLWIWMCVGLCAIVSCALSCLFCSIFICLFLSYSILFYCFCFLEDKINMIKKYFSHTLSLRDSFSYL